MKVLLYMAVSLDGFIADEDDKTPWSDEEWKLYAKAIKKYGNLIIGRKTYTIMKEQDEFASLGDPFVVVVSKEKTDSNTLFVDSPQKALAAVEEKGFTTAFLGGGSQLIASFLQEKLIDEVMLDVEPLFLGEGKPLFPDDFNENSLQLVNSQRYGEKGVQQHFKLIY